MSHQIIITFLILVFVSKAGWGQDTASFWHYPCQPISCDEIAEKEIDSGDYCLFIPQLGCNNYPEYETFLLDNFKTHVKNGDTVILALFNTFKDNESSRLEEKKNLEYAAIYSYKEDSAIFKNEYYAFGEWKNKFRKKRITSFKIHPRQTFPNKIIKEAMFSKKRTLMKGNYRSQWVHLSLVVFDKETGDFKILRQNIVLVI